MKDSGVGRRHGREGIVQYCEPPTVAVQRLCPSARSPGWGSARYGQTMTLAGKALANLAGVT